MAQAVDSVDLITTRHMLTTVFHYNDAICNAADMKSQSLLGMIKTQVFAKQHNLFVITDIIN